jgi:hypothetical protein
MISAIALGAETCGQCPASMKTGSTPRRSRTACAIHDGRNVRSSVGTMAVEATSPGASTSLNAATGANLRNVVNATTDAAQYPLRDRPAGLRPAVACVTKRTERADRFTILWRPCDYTLGYLTGPGEDTGGVPVTATVDGRPCTAS